MNEEVKAYQDKIIKALKYNINEKMVVVYDNVYTQERIAIFINRASGMASRAVEALLGQGCPCEKYFGEYWGKIRHKVMNKAYKIKLDGVNMELYQEVEIVKGREIY